jgi:hypothetical protein
VIEKPLRHALGKVAKWRAYWELIEDNPDVWYWSERFVEMNSTADAEVVSKI